ncbi:MAG TPA: hypothetical protein VF149_06750, partial [Bacillales bacterium]
KGDRNWNWPKKQWLSGFSAVIVGLVMGIAVLMMFTDHDTKQASAKWKQNQETEKEAGTSAASGSETAAVPQDLGMTLQIVQGAAFSTKANGKSAVDNLRGSGFAAVLNQDENSVHMFIGVGLKESNSEALGKLYKKQGQDFYVKTFQIQAQSDQLEQKTAVFLGKAEPIMKKMIAGSVSGLTSASGQAAFTDNQWAELETQMKQLEVQAGGDTGTLADELNAAMKSLKKYRGSSDPAALWQAQQALLRAVLSYQSLIE